MRALRHAWRMSLVLPPVITAYRGAESPRRVLPHEWAFGGWLAAMACGLLLLAGPAHPSTLWFAGLALVGPLLRAWCLAHPTQLRWRVRLLWYPCAMGFAFYALPAAIAVLGRPGADALLAGLDQHLLGAAAAERLAALQSPWMTDGLLLAYLFFFVVLIFGPGHYCWHDLARFRACIAGLFTLYALGFAGYVWLPAQGPAAALLPSLGPLPLGPIAERMRPVIAAASNGVDVFPSIHFAASLFLWLFDWRHHRARFWRWSLPILALWLSTLYLRYHYLVDLLAGMVPALVGFAVATAEERRGSVVAGHPARG